MIDGWHTEHESGLQYSLKIGSVAFQYQLGELSHIQECNLHYMVILLEDNQFELECFVVFHLFTIFLNAPP